MENRLKYIILKYEEYLTNELDNDKDLVNEIISLKATI